MKNSVIQIGSALVWAASIIACSIVLEGNSGSEIIRNILITGATMNFLLLSVRSHSISKKNEAQNCK